MLPEPDINVLVSYSHEDKDHEDKALAFADRLRANGINAMIDQYQPAPPEGWPHWMEAQVRKADFVLMVCTATYHERIINEQKPGEGLGVSWEGHLIFQHLYKQGNASNKFLPILFEGGNVADIPAPVSGKTYYRVDKDSGYENLYRLLTNQPDAPPEPLGTRLSLPPKARPANP